MDNQQPNVGNLPPGYSANDLVNSPSGQQPLTNQGGLPPGYSANDLVNTSATPSYASNPTEMQEGDDLATKAAKGVTGALEGVGEGVFGTLAGGADIVNKITGQKPGAITNELHTLAGTDEQKSGSEQIGGGLETIGEFLLGDAAAMKGLSVADKLGLTSKVLKMVDGFPKLKQALQLGINVGKAGTELSPEERALLKQYPVLARLAAAGQDALRQGVVQGTQTLVKTGGNVGEAAKQSAEMAGGSAVLGGALGTAGGLLAKGGEAAANAGELQEAAKAAPTSEEANQQLQNAVQNTQQPGIDAATQAQQEAQEKIAGAQGAVEGILAGAPTKEQIAKTVQDAVKTAEDNLSNAYENKVNSAKSLLANNTIDYHNTEIKNTVQDLLGQAEKNKEYLPSKFKVPSPLTPNTERWLQGLEHYGETLEKGEDGKDQWIPQATPVTADDLIDIAKQVKSNIRNTSYLTPEGRADRDAYFKLLDSVHQSLKDLANSAGKPEAYNAVGQANSAYKEGINNLKHPDVQRLLEGSKENSIIDTLSGGKSVADIKTIKKVIGNEAFAKITDDAMSRLAADSYNPATGQLDMKRWITNMNKIPNDVRAEMFNGTTRSGALENILKQVQGVNASGVLDASQTSIDEAEKTVRNILGSTPDLKGLANNPEKVQQLSQLLGPEATGELGNSLLQSQLREAATKTTGTGVKIGAVNAEKFLNFVNSFKDSPETVEALFRSTPERAAAYDKLLQSVHNVHNVKEMVKLGIITPVIGATAGGLVGHTGLSLMLGAAAAEGAGGSVKFARDILDHIANHPNTWKALSALGKANIGQGTVANLAKIAAGKGATGIRQAATNQGVSNTDALKNVYQNTATQLSNQ